MQQRGSGRAPLSDREAMRMRTRCEQVEKPTLPLTLLFPPSLLPSKERTLKSRTIILHILDKRLNSCYR